VYVVLQIFCLHLFKSFNRLRGTQNRISSKITTGEQATMTSRRKFLKQGTLGAFAAGVSLGLGNRSGAAAISSSSALGLNRAAFASQLRTTFHIKQSSQNIPLTLIDVAEIGSRHTVHGLREAFALVLRGSNDTPLQQDTYAIEHEKLGAFSFLMVPIGSPDKSSRYYEININRLHG
jgi:hypothetical protein